MKTNTYLQGNKDIEEDNKRIIKDYTYHFFPDFFKPTMLEYGLFVAEVFPYSLSLITGLIGNYISKGDLATTIASGLIPQILTYASFRLVELCALTTKRGKILLLNPFKRSKKTFPYKPKITIETIDDIVKDNSTQTPNH